MNEKDKLTVIRSDELINLLEALAMTGGCDLETLRIVAKAAGVGDYFNPPPPVRQVVQWVESPVALLESTR